MRSFVNVILPLLLPSLFDAQEITIDHYPVHPTSVSDPDYSRGRYMLENTYAAITNDQGELTYADYWNVGVGYSYMGVGHDSILVMFKRAKDIDEESFCAIQRHFLPHEEVRESRLFKMLGTAFEDLTSTCYGMTDERMSLGDRIAEKESMELTGLDESLIDQLIILLDKDQRYRSIPGGYEANWEKQNSLDKEVQIALKEIFDDHGYPGLSRVGEKYSAYACLLLEHGGDLDFQETYLPLVAEALANGELEKSVFSMLIDRIHWKKTKKQIFGSHVGVPFDIPEVVEAVKRKYGF